MIVTLFAIQVPETIKFIEVPESILIGTGKDKLSDSKC